MNARDKRRFVKPLQKYLLNPPVRHAGLSMRQPLEAMILWRPRSAADRPAHRESAH